jgi:hypothetical protein
MNNLLSLTYRAPYYLFAIKKIHRQTIASWRIFYYALCGGGGLDSVRTQQKSARRRNPSFFTAIDRPS